MNCEIYFQCLSNGSSEPRAGEIPRPGGVTNLSIQKIQIQQRTLPFLMSTKHLMTGPKGNSEFCFPETLNVLRGEIFPFVNLTSVFAIMNPFC